MGEAPGGLDPALSDVFRSLPTGKMLPAKRQHQLDGKSLPGEKRPQPPSRNLGGQAFKGLELSRRGSLGDVANVPLTEGLLQCVGDLRFGNALGPEFPREAGRTHGMTMGPSAGPRPGVRAVVQVSGDGESGNHRLDLIRDISASCQALPEFLRGQGPHAQEGDCHVPRVRALRRWRLPPPLPAPHQILLTSRSHHPDGAELEMGWPSPISRSGVLWVRRIRATVAASPGSSSERRRTPPATWYRPWR